MKIDKNVSDKDFALAVLNDVYLHASNFDTIVRIRKKAESSGSIIFIQNREMQATMHLLTVDTIEKFIHFDDPSTLESLKLNVRGYVHMIIADVEDGTIDSFDPASASQNSRIVNWSAPISVFEEAEKVVSRMIARCVANPEHAIDEYQRMDVQWHKETGRNIRLRSPNTGELEAIASLVSKSSYYNSLAFVLKEVRKISSEANIMSFVCGDAALIVPIVGGSFLDDTDDVQFEHRIQSKTLTPEQYRLLLIEQTKDARSTTESLCYVGVPSGMFENAQQVFNEWPRFNRDPNRDEVMAELLALHHPLQILPLLKAMCEAVRLRKIVLMESGSDGFGVCAYSEEKLMEYAVTSLDLASQGVLRSQIPAGSIRFVLRQLDRNVIGIRDCDFDEVKKVAESIRLNLDTCRDVADYTAELADIVKELETFRKLNTRHLSLVPSDGPSVGALPQEDIAWFKKNKDKNFYVRQSTPREYSSSGVDGVVIHGMAPTGHTLVIFGVGQGKGYRFGVTKPSREAEADPWVLIGAHFYRASDIVSGLRRLRGILPDRLEDAVNDIKHRDAERYKWVLEHPRELLVDNYRAMKTVCKAADIDHANIRNTTYDSIVAIEQIRKMRGWKQNHTLESSLVRALVLKYSLWSQRDFPVYVPTKAAIEQAIDPRLLPDDRLPVTIPYASLFIDLRNLRTPFQVDEMIGTGVQPVYLTAVCERIDPLFDFNQLGRLDDVGLSHLAVEGMRAGDREIIDKVCVQQSVSWAIYFNDGEHRCISHMPMPSQWSQWRVYASWLRENGRYVEGNAAALLSGLFYNLAKLPTSRTEHGSHRQANNTVKAPISIEGLREMSVDRNTEIAVTGDVTVTHPVETRGPLDTSRLHLVMTTVRSHNHGYWVGSGTDRQFDIRRIEEKQSSRWMSEETILRKLFDGEMPK